MIVFLTSSPCDDFVPGGTQLPCTLNEANGFVDRLRKRLKPGARMVIVAADPHAPERNDEMAATFAGAFAHHGMPLAGVSVLDARTEEHAARMIELSDAVMLSGGHVPTEHAFFERIGLRSLLHGYTGLVLGISAGTMNAARTVYVQPELPGESVDPDFVRFVPGLGLTDVMILPHYQKVKDSLLDGKRLFEDITYADSMGRTFIAIVDGSYLLIENGSTRLFGEAYRIADGRIQKLCTEGDNVTL